jgi:pseudouridine synthase
VVLRSFNLVQLLFTRELHLTLGALGMVDSALAEPPISLLRYLCSGGLKRLPASQALSDSKVRVNGDVICCGSSLVYCEDTVTVDGENINAFKASSAVVVAFNKPCGLQIGAPHRLSTRNSSGCSFEASLAAIARDLRVPRLFAIGRLDKETSGLLLLTNDGALSSACRTPGLLCKTYIVTSRLRRVVNDGESFEHVAEIEEARARAYCQRLTSAPICLSDGPVEFSEANCLSVFPRAQKISGRFLSGQHPKHHAKVEGSDSDRGDLLLCTLQVLVKVSLKIGRYRVVRRAVAAAGLPVNALHRCMIGPIELRDADPSHQLAPTAGSLPVSLEVGGHALLSQSEVQQLWHHMFGARGRESMADLRVKMLRQMCEPQGSRENDGRLHAWLRCHEHKFAASLGSAVDEGDSSDDQD